MRCDADVVSSHRREDAGTRKALCGSARCVLRLDQSETSRKVCGSCERSKRCHGVCVRRLVDVLCLA
eukprot:COSAG03_NODE_780_length_5888_cov_2.083607_9_plen_67_part_00